MNRLQRFVIELGFKGTQYHGWQKQTNALSVQEMLERAYYESTGKEISFTGCGRTDTGVHAHQFFVHADTDVIPERLLLRLNALLPHDIRVFALYKVRKNFSVRHHALFRTYIYRITLIPDPMLTDRAWYINRKPDLELMNRASEIVKKYHDFSSFCKSRTQVKHYNCDIYFAQWESTGTEILFTIQANRFLRNMVRAITGTMIELGMGHININDFESIIASKSRSHAGESVPAQGLTLQAIEYEKDALIRLDKIYNYE